MCISVSSSSDWSIWRIPGQTQLHSETLSQKEGGREERTLKGDLKISYSGLEKERLIKSAIGRGECEEDERGERQGLYIISLK